MNVCKFYFIDQGIAAYYIRIALIKLTVSSFLGPVGSPHWLYLVSFEGKTEMAVVHGHIPGKWNGEIIFQCSFCNGFCVLPLQNVFKLFSHLPFFGWIIQTVVKDLEDQFITFFTILPHQGVQLFYRRSFQRLESIQLKYASDCVE